MSAEHEARNTEPFAAPAKSAGGGGFNHADEVSAYFFAALLAGVPPFAPRLGSVTGVEFEAKSAGWLIDDLLLTLDGADGTRHCAISIKSNRQFAADSSAPEEFVRDCWTQMLDGGPMQPDRDLLALAVSGLSANVLEDFSTLRDLAEASDRDSLEQRLTMRGYVDAGKRRMAESFQCPEDIAAKYAADNAPVTAELIARVLVLDFDFPSASSRSRREALQICRHVLHDPSTEASERLWEELCILARELRPRSGKINLTGLVSRLRVRHNLLNYPDHRRDWERLTAHTKAQLEHLTRWSLGGRVSLTRLHLRQQLDAIVKPPDDATSSSNVVALIGQSGDGKSVLARQWLATGSPQLWLDARLFDPSSGQDSLRAAESRLGLSHSLATLLPPSGGSHPRFVLDGLGRLFDEGALGVVARLLHAAVDSGWQCLITCQDDEWDRVRPLLQTAGMSIPALPVGTLDEGELNDVAACEPRLSALLAKPTLRPVLSRPKYLDVLIGRAAADNAGTFTEAANWVGEADVAAWCWRQVVEGSPPRVSRSAAAREIALKQGDAVRDSIAEDDLDPAHLSAVDELIREEVCRKVGERLVFDHDLLGDWARQRILLSRAGELIQFLRSANRSASPLWLRSLRLWALDVLDRQQNLNEWLSVVRGLFAAGELGAADRVLEAAAIGATAAQQLDKLWATLTNEPVLLRRLLQRFLYVASVPNPAVLRIAAKLRKKDEHDTDNWVAAHFRIPDAFHWPTLLNAIHGRRDDLALYAPQETARILGAWLRHTLLDAPARVQAAEIALTIAWRVWATTNHQARSARGPERLREWSLCHEAESDAYTAVLLATPTLPKEVKAFVRTAAARAPWVDTDTADEPGVVYAQAWPDGPSHRVGDEFRSALLANDTFLLLAAALPDVAAEALLAVLIEPPELLKHPGMLGLSYDEERELSIVHVFHWSPPFYTRGPFATFLEATPDAAVGAIIRLVNFATNRWVERETRDLHGLRGQQGAPKPVIITFDRASPPVYWQGDADVYSWYLGDSRAPDPVTCSLMALERWLYARLDAGKDISETVSRIAREGQSVAFAGLLSAICRYATKLLKGPVAFLTGVPEFLYWELRPAHDIATSALWAWQLLPREPPHLSKAARDWYQMPHRRNNLFTVAQFYFLNDPQFREIQREWLPIWRDRLSVLGPDANEAGMLNECLNAFDLEQWEVIELPDGRGKGWRRRATEEEQAARNTALQEATDEMLIIEFPHRCRDLLNRPDLLRDQELDQFWADLNRVAVRLADDISATQPAETGAGLDVHELIAAEMPVIRRRSLLDGVMGGAAVLLCRHEGWLDRDRKRKAWVLRHVHRIPHIRIPDSPLETGHPDETNDYRWECFFAQIVVKFWCRKPASHLWRFQAARIATGFHYSPIRQLFLDAYNSRSELIGGFQELHHLLMKWAAVRWHWEHARNGWPINVDIQADWQRLIRDFLDGRLAGNLPGCQELAMSPRVVPERPAPPQQFRRGLDVPVVAAALHGILRLNEAASPVERQRWILFWRDLLDWRLSPEQKEDEAPASEEDGSDDNDWPRNSLPYRSDNWLLDRLAGVVLELTLHEQPELVWKPILDLVPKLRHWTEHFLTGVFVIALRSDPTPGDFLEIWKSMTEHAFNCSKWTGADDETWAHLLGFDHLCYSYWEQRHSTLLRAMKPYLASFLEARIGSGWRLSELLRLLQKPAAEEIRLDLLVPLSEALHRRPDMLGYDGTPGSVASFIDFILARHKEQVSNREDLFTAVGQTLRALGAVNDPLAEQLQNRLRRT